MKIAAIVLAAGKGSRMQSNCPKQFMDLCGKPVVYYSLWEFSLCEEIDQIILVTGKDDIDYCKREIIEKYNIPKISQIVAGGSERYWSVRNGLQEVKECSYVLIHDAARPCLTQDMIRRSIDTVKETGACTVGVPVKDTIKVVDDEGYGVDTPDRQTLWQIQTPQSFSVEKLLDAYEEMEKKNDTQITDDTMIMERYGGCKSKVIMGNYCNIKITTPEDLKVAEFFLKK